MAVAYTQRILATNATANTAVDSIVVPMGFRWVLRDLVVGGGAIAGLVTVWIVSGSDAWVVFNQVVDAQTVAHLELRQAVEAGELVRAYSGTVAFSILATAYQLTV